jgi:hypothetical protein
MKRFPLILVLLLLLAIAIAVTAAAQDNNEPLAVSPPRLAVAHLAPFAGDPGTAVTVTLDATPVLTNFAYGDSTEYLELTAGTYLVEIFPEGSTTAAISGTVTLADGTDYTAIATGDGVNQPLELQALVDDNTAPAGGNAKLRLGHLAPFASGDALADIRLQDGTVVLANVAYTATAYQELPPLPPAMAATSRWVPSPCRPVRRVTSCLWPPTCRSPTWRPLPPIRARR